MCWQSTWWCWPPASSSSSTRQGRRSPSAARAGALQEAPPAPGATARASPKSSPSRTPKSTAGSPTSSPPSSTTPAPPPRPLPTRRARSSAWLCARRRRRRPWGRSPRVSWQWRRRGHSCSHSERLCQRCSLHSAPSTASPSPWWTRRRPARLPRSPRRSAPPHARRPPRPHTAAAVMPRQPRSRDPRACRADQGLWAWRVATGPGRA
mmetsp:Transcript_22344/g.69795  ORF Transcript_22344/g.69795 Transcript_22344/m.69795 type:complete len:208 (-) Transcript_22344:448-1071(-)